MNRDTFDIFSDREDRGRFGDNESQSVRGNDSVRSDLHDIDLVLHHMTDKALCVFVDGTELRAQWIPKSRCEFTHKNTFVMGVRKDGRHIEFAAIAVTISERLAKEKGLV